MGMDGFGIGIVLAVGLVGSAAGLGFTTWICAGLAISLLADLNRLTNRMRGNDSGPEQTKTKGETLSHHRGRPPTPTYYRLARICRYLERERERG